MQTKEKVEFPTHIKPIENIPIIMEFSEEDRNRAKPYKDVRHCLVCTTLQRMGYENIIAGSERVFIGGRTYCAEGITATDLTESGTSDRPYLPDVVGRQIILYPA